MFGVKPFLFKASAPAIPLTLPVVPSKPIQQLTNAEDFLFDALCRLQTEFNVKSIDEVQHAIQNSYRMFAEFQKV